MDPTLEAIVKALPFFHRAFFGEVLFSVVDGEKVVAYLPGELDLGIKVGGPFVRNSAAWDAYHTGTDQFREVAQEQSAFGVPYIVNAVPVRNDSGNIVGLVEEIRRLAQDSSESAGRIADTLRDIQMAVGDAALLTREVSEAANSQAAALSQLVASIEELRAASEEVNQLMASLSKVF